MASYQHELVTSPFSGREELAIRVSERVMSVLSILGSIFIITTFWKWHYFRKPINRLVFYASFGNITVNIATLIGTSGIPKEKDGFNALCEFQGILIQWFMAADSLWVFSMALNVQLVFFRGYNSMQLRHLEKWYLLFAYGVPGVVALIYIMMDHIGDTRIIGNATLWCWVRSDVDWMRIAFFYGPVWAVIFCTMAIYTVTGWKIFRRGSELHSLSKKVAADQESGNTLHSPHNSADLGIIKVETTMQVETSPPEGTWDPEAASPASQSRSSFGSTKQLSSTIEIPAPAHVGRPPRPSRDTEHRSGYRAMAFATNRTRELDAEPSRSMSITNTHVTRRRNGMKINAAALGYFKVAFLMFAALVWVWVPSTANRLQQFVQKDKPSVFGLQLASAIVLPMQGFWNAMIYTSTTLPECKRAIAEVTGRFSRRDSESLDWHSNNMDNSVMMVTQKLDDHDSVATTDMVIDTNTVSQQKLPTGVSSVEDVDIVHAVHKA